MHHPAAFNDLYNMDPYTAVFADYDFDFFEDPENAPGRDKFVDDDFYNEIPDGDFDDEDIN